MHCHGEGEMTKGCGRLSILPRGIEKQLSCQVGPQPINSWGRVPTETPPPGAPNTHFHRHLLPPGPRHAVTIPSGRSDSLRNTPLSDLIRVSERHPWHFQGAFRISTRSQPLLVGASVSKSWSSSFKAGAKTKPSSPGDRESPSRRSPSLRPTESPVSWDLGGGEGRRALEVLLGWEASRSKARGWRGFLVSFQMHRCAALLFASFIFCAALSETFGLVLSVSIAYQTFFARVPKGRAPALP